MEITNSFNFFIDTDRAADYGDTQSRGDDVHIHLGGNTIEAGEGEVLRLSLVQFTMHNNIWMINETNNELVCRTNGADTAEAKAIQPLTIDQGNYKNFGSISQNIGQKISDHLVLRSQAILNSPSPQTVTTTIKPPASDIMREGTRVFDMLITFPAAHGITDLKIQCFKNQNDSYLIMGADGLYDTETTLSSLTCTIPTTTTIQISGLYSMQRMSDPHVYLRCRQATTNLEQAIHASPRGPWSADVTNSDIIGKVYRDHEFITFHTDNGEYFVTLQQRKLSSLHLRLTDAKGRLLARNDNTNTASGSGANQSTRGNLCFSAILRIDTIRVSHPHNLQTDPPLPLLPAREAQAPLIWQNYGRPKF